MADDRLEKVIKPQGETLQKGFGNSNTLKPSPPNQTGNNQSGGQSSNSNGNQQR